MGKQYRDNEISGEGHVLDLLSAYIDRSLEEPERERVRAHIEDCADCRAGYIELQATMRMVQSMPVAVVPRAFTLTPEMAARVRKPSLLERIFSPRLAPTFATGSVVAFVMLFFLFAGSSFLNPAKFEPAITGTGPSALVAPTDQTAKQEAPSAGNDTTSSTAESTSLPDAAGSTAQDSSEKLPGEPTEPTVGAAAPPVPAGTQLPEGIGGGLPEEQVTPDTDIAGSGTSSPTTVAIEPPAPDASGAGITQNYSNSAEAEDSDQQTALAQSQPGQDMNLLLVAEIGLLALGLALAAAAIIARRRAA